MDFWATVAAFRFEFRRTLTPARMIFGTALAMFPVAIVLLMKYVNQAHAADGLAAMQLNHAANEFSHWNRPRLRNTLNQTSCTQSAT